VPGFFYCAFGGQEGAFWSSGEYVPATIYVGPNAGEFRNGPNGPSQHWTHPIVLAEGANPVFRPRSFTGASIICEGVISGAGGISKFDDAGTLYLYTNNTYAGPTTIRGGPLALGVNGSISNSVRIDVWTNGIFDVTAKAGGFVLQPAQTLQGNGTVRGNVIALGTLAPGSSIGILTNNGNLTLAGTVLIELDKSGTPSNDRLHVTGSLSHSGGGSIQVVNLGPALAPGDSFPIFNQPVVNGQTMSVSGGGAVWTNKLAVDGSIAVLSVSPPGVPATNLTIAVSGPWSRTLGGWGAAHSAYYVYASTNVTLPMSNWWLIGVTNSDAGGLIQFVDTGATNAQRFYRFGQPAP
jgi:autotransporter-associated beta strand protein